MKRKKLDYEKLRRKFPSMNKISSRLASFLEYGEYLTYTNEEIRNMFLSLLKTFNKDCIDLKLRYDLLKLENDKFEDTLIQYENINELDDEEVSSFVRTKDFVDYIGYSQKQKQLIFNLLKKSEQNLNELISEILLSSEVREALKNDLIDSINVSNRSWLNSLNSEYGNTLENILIKFENDRTLKRIELWKKIINSFISNLYDLEDKNYYYVIKYSYIDNLETKFILERLNLSLQELKEVKRELRYKIYQKALEIKLFKEVVNIEQCKSNFYS